MNRSFDPNAPTSGGTSNAALNAEQFVTASKVFGLDATTSMLRTSFDEVVEIVGQLRTGQNAQVGAAVADKIHDTLNRLTALGATALAHQLSQLELLLRSGSPCSDTELDEILQALSQCQSSHEQLTADVQL